MTTTSSAIEAVWLDAIWQSNTILGITDKIQFSQPTQESSAELGKFYSTGDKYINCIVATTTKSESYIGASVLQERFTVKVDYYRQKDVGGDAWLEVRDFFETLTALIKSSLGDTWDSTVSYWRVQEGPPDITDTKIQSTSAWVGTITYTGFI